MTPHSSHGLDGVGVPGRTSRTETLQQSALRKNAWRILPLMIAALIFSYIDKNNAGFAALTMMSDLHLSTGQFGWGASLFFVGYCAFEVPSNLALYRHGARKWLARIMITWGLAVAATAFAVGPYSFYALRFLVGVGEAGFFPGATFLLACWFPVQYRTRILATFMLGAPLASVIGGPMSGALFQLNGLLGLHGWQWMFIAQGIPASIVGVLIYVFIRDDPSAAHWLSDDERKASVEELRVEAESGHKSTSLSALRDWRILLLGLIQFGFVIGTYGVGIWLPLILSEYGYGSFKIGMLTAIPYVFACVGTFVWARFTDRSKRHVMHLRLACLLGTIGFAISTLAMGVEVQLVGITLAVIAVFAARSIFWTIPSTFLSGRAAAGGLAVINTIGTLGGFVGTLMVGKLRDAYGSYIPALWAMAAAFLMSALLTLLLTKVGGRRRATAMASA